MRLIEGPNELAGPENLGNPGEFTMIELAEAVRDLTGSSSELVHAPLPQDDPKQRQPDILRPRPVGLGATGGATRGAAAHDCLL